jgi:hypothetical protein
MIVEITIKSNGKKCLIEEDRTMRLFFYLHGNIDVLESSLYDPALFASIPVTFKKN